ncbi:MAG: hypothetical protein OJF49_002064 [Ktedonobacterales bacterium]|nr:MAG: hypothetical protein OJF49_002064 [Ktedonobacterales bacterium]
MTSPLAPPLLGTPPWNDSEGLRSACPPWNGAEGLCSAGPTRRGVNRDSAASFLRAHGGRVWGRVGRDLGLDET